MKSEPIRPVRNDHITLESSSNQDTPVLQEVPESDIARRVEHMRQEERHDKQALGSTSLKDLRDQLIQLEASASSDPPVLSTPTEAPPSYFRSHLNQATHSLAQLHHIMSDMQDTGVKLTESASKQMESEGPVIQKTGQRIRKRYPIIQHFLDAVSAVSRLKHILSKGTASDARLDDRDRPTGAEAIRITNFAIASLGDGEWELNNQSLMDYIQELEEEHAAIENVKANNTLSKALKELGESSEDNAPMEVPPLYSTTDPHPEHADPTSLHVDHITTTQRIIMETATSVQVFMLTIQNMIEISRNMLSSHDRVTAATQVPESDSVQQLDRLSEAVEHAKQHKQNNKIEMPETGDTSLSSDIRHVAQYATFLSTHLNKHLEWLDGRVQQLGKLRQSLHQHLTPVLDQLTPEAKESLSDHIKAQQQDICELEFSVKRLHATLKTVLEQATDKTNFVEDFDSAIQTLRLNNNLPAHVDLPKKDPFASAPTQAPSPSAPRAARTSNSQLEHIHDNTNVGSSHRNVAPSEKRIRKLYNNKDLEETFNHISPNALLTSDPVEMLFRMWIQQAIFRMGWAFIESYRAELGKVPDDKKRYPINELLRLDGRA